MCPSTPATSASCPWPGTTASPCVWSCWAVMSRHREEGREPAPRLPLPAPALTSHPPLHVPTLRRWPGGLPLPRVGAGAAALHFTGLLQVGCGDGSCLLVAPARAETPSCNWGFPGDTILQMRPCWGTLSCNQGLALSSQLSLGTNFLLPASASSREAAASGSPLPELGLGAQPVFRVLGQAPLASSLQRPSCSLLADKQGL